MGTSRDQLPKRTPDKRASLTTTPPWDRPANREDLQQVIGSCPTPMAVCDLDGITHDCNQAIIKMIGCPSQDTLRGDSILDHVVPEERERADKLLGQVRNGGVVHEAPLTLLGTNGRRVPVEMTLWRLPDSSGIPNQVLMMARDAKPQRQVEQVLQRREAQTQQKYRQLFDTIPDAILLTDAETDLIVDCNASAVDLYGYSRQEFLQTSWQTLQVSRDRHAKSDITAEEVNPRAIVYQQRKNGTLFPAEINITPFLLNAQSLQCRTIREVTSQVETKHEIDWLNRLREELLKPSSLEEKLQRVTDELVSHHDVDFARIWMTAEGDRCDRGCAHATVTEGPHVCKFRNRCLHLKASSGRYTHLDGEVHGRVPFGCYKIGRVAAGSESRFLTHDITNDPQVHNHEWATDLGLISFAGYRLVSPQGTPIGVLALFSKCKIDQQRDALFAGLAATTSHVIWTTKTEEESRRLATAMQQSDEAVIMTDVKLTIQYVNPALEHISGFRGEDVRGWPFKSLLKENSSADSLIEIRKVIEQHNTWRGRLTGQRKDGSQYEADTVVSQVQDKAGHPANYVIMMRDVSDLTRMETQLRQSQKMEAIGTLAGGIAHDFNNILYAILGYAELASDAIEDNSPLQECLDGIRTAGQRATDLVGRILAFSHRSKVEFTPLHLGAIVNDALDFMRNSLPATIELKRNLDPNLEKVSAEPTQIHQVIMNLCANAFHAMRGSHGTLTVTLQKTRIMDDSTNHILDLEAGDYAQLSVRDTGTGIEEEVRRRIFEPYFTTKKIGEGTGMGLATVHSIVRSMHGAITVSSTVGEGTCFDLYIPFAASEVKQHTADVSQHGSARGVERILLVDDEESITRVGCVSLTRMGYDVTAYTDSREALSEFRRDPGQFDIVIADLTMPHITGAELAETLLASRPDLPIVLCTGNSGLLPREEALRIGVAEYLEKPIEMRALARVVRRILDKTTVRGV